MKVQKVIVEEKSYPLYILLDKEFEVIEPVKRFIKYLDNTGKLQIPLKHIVIISSCFMNL